MSSLCAKWAPPPKQAHDRNTLIATPIAELLYPAEEFRRPGMSACDYTELARRSYAKEYLKPLREAACVPEVGPLSASINNVACALDSLKHPTPSFKSPT